MRSFKRVYICNRSHHDFRAAARWGELVYLTEGEIDRYDVGWMFRRIKPVLDGSEEFDFILPTSLPILVGICSSLMVAKHGMVNYLLFTRKDPATPGTYIERTVSFKDYYESDWRL